MTITALKEIIRYAKDHYRLRKVEAECYANELFAVQKQDNEVVVVSNDGDTYEVRNVYELVGFIYMIY